MKITHVIPALTRGGAERVVVDLANAACDRGHEVTILCGYPADPALFAIDDRVRLRTIRGKGPVRHVYPSLIPWILKNRRWLFEQDIVHCHLTLGAVFGSILRILRRASPRNRPKILETSHAVGMPIPAGRRKLLARLAANRDGYVLMAEDAFWRSFSESHPRLPLRIIPNGTRLDRPVPDEPLQSSYRRGIGLPADGVLVVGTIGRLSADRNPAAMLEVFAHVLGSRDDVHVVMGGEGPLLESLQSEARSRGFAERIHFPGLVLDVPLALSVLDLYVSMNVGPITGLAGLEAAAAGIPVLSLQARSDYLAGVEDWIWSDLEPGAVAREVLRLLASEEERGSLAKRQLQHVRDRLSTNAAYRAYEGFYQELLA